MNPSQSLRRPRWGDWREHLRRVGALVLAVPLASAAQSDLPSVRCAYAYDSGWVESPLDEPAIVISQLVVVRGAEWLRLSFRSIELGQATLRLVSARDGGVQELSAQHCREWRDTSAYFNGDSVLVEVVTEPGGGAVRVVLDGVDAGVPPASKFTVCGATDDRVLSNDRSSARVLPALCTAFLIDDCNRCLLSAGHCVGGVAVAQFNVPLSSANSVIVHPSPDEQYAVDASSLQFQNDGPGSDWSYFGCFANPGTGLTPFERQQQARVLAASAPAFDPACVMRVTGYGFDLTTPTENYVQQTHRGPYFPWSGTTLAYLVDTTGGNSGSAVQWDQHGVTIGIHTHSGCDVALSDGNHGTAIEQAALQAALANPRGLCSRSGTAAVYCTAKVNSQGCLPAISYSGVPSASGGAFTLAASLVLNNQLGRLIYGAGANDTPFQGGTLCVSAPIVRTPPQLSGGNAAAPDCSGAYSFDMGAWIASGIDPRLAPGATACAQFWSRDAHSASGPIGLTDAVQFTIGP